MRRLLTAFVTLTLTHSAQEPQLLTFEAASVKPVPPADPFALLASGNAMVSDPGRLELRAVNVATLITIAWHIRLNEIAGPDWIRTSHYDLKAKLPEGATQAQLPEMIRSLLSERFGLVVHEERKEVPGYALLPDRSGVKLRESASAPATEHATKQDSGKPDLAQLVRPRNTKITPSPDGTMRFESTGMTPAVLAATLSQYLGKPVVDETNLTGRYDVTLELPAQAAAAAMFKLSGAAAPPKPDSDSNEGAIFGSVQKMGLRLEARKVPLKMLVVDKGNSTPSEN